MAKATATAIATLPADVRLMNVTAAVFAALGVLAIVAAVVIAIARQGAFAISGIHIDGDVARNGVSTIRANAAPRLAGHFFGVDLAQAKDAFESVPWVRSATVRRVFPNRLAVTLEEHRPAALWTGEGDLLVNTHGEVFQANPGDVDEASLPVFDGPDGSGAQLLAMHAALVPVFAPTRIAALRLSGRGSWRARLDGGATVELGRGSEAEVAERTRVFVATFAQVAQRHGSTLAHADLRHREGYALKLKGVTTNAPDKKTR